MIMFDTRCKSDSLCSIVRIHYLLLSDWLINSFLHYVKYFPFTRQNYLEDKCFLFLTMNVLFPITDLRPLTTLRSFENYSFQISISNHLFSLYYLASSIAGSLFKLFLLRDLNCTSDLLIPILSGNSRPLRLYIASRVVKQKLHLPSHKRRLKSAKYFGSYNVDLRAFRTFGLQIKSSLEES